MPNPVPQVLRPGGLGIGVVAGAQHRHEHLRALLALGWETINSNLRAFPHQTHSSVDLDLAQQPEVGEHLADAQHHRGQRIVGH
jgi:hypothetical protein